MQDWRTQQTLPVGGRPDCNNFLRLLETAAGIGNHAQHQVICPATMVQSESAEQRPFVTPQDEEAAPPPILTDAGLGSGSLTSQSSGWPCQGRLPRVFVFNPFTEGHIAQGKAYTPVRHQAALAADLANLPQFLSRPGDIVLLPRKPSESFLNFLQEAGFPSPEFVELKAGGVDPADSLCRRQLGDLRPWAWGPDSVGLLEPLLARVAGNTRSSDQCFNGGIAQLYSKTWSASFLEKVLGQSRRDRPPSLMGTEAQSRLGVRGIETWLCSEQEVGVAVDNLEDALGAIAAIRDRGHHRIVVKEAVGLAGHNAIRLWEPELLPTQRRWLAHALGEGRQLVIEPWLERELDFSVQLEMGADGLALCGYTGLVNDRKGQFLANWAEGDYARRLPAKVAAAFPAQPEMPRQFQHLYAEIFSLLEAELRRVGFVGPVGIDAFVYRTRTRDCRLKPVVEINPRHTMGRLTVELMKHVCPGSCGLFRLVGRAQARAEGFPDLSSYAHSLRERCPLRIEGGSAPRIRQGALCLNDPGQAQVCLATFEVSPELNLPGRFGGQEPQRSD